MRNNVTIIPPRESRSDTLRVAAYCQVSSDSSDQLHSYAAQIRKYTEEIMPIFCVFLEMGRGEGRGLCGAAQGTAELGRRHARCRQQAEETAPCSIEQQHRGA